jgi:hypothetical protein
MLRFLYERPSNSDPALHGSEARPASAGEDLSAASPLNGPDSGTEADGAGPPGASRAGLDELLPEAQRIDQAHRFRHHRPVSAETLRKQMRIGSMRARSLVQQIRDSHDSTVHDTSTPGHGMPRLILPAVNDDGASKTTAVAD